MSRHVVLVLTEEQRAHLLEALEAMSANLEGPAASGDLQAAGRLHQTYLLHRGIANVKPETEAMSAMLPVTVK